jgi:ABC-type sugar transport system permease subunit
VLIIFNFYKESYNAELENKEKINNRITVPISILTLLIGGILIYFKEIDKISNVISKVFFILFLGLSIIAILFCVFFLFKAYYGYTYKYIPLLKDIQDYQNGLIDYYLNENHNYENASYLAELDVQLYLENIYVESTTNNMEQNEKKLRYLRQAGWALSSILLTSVLAYLPYFIGLDKNEIHKVNIVEIPKETKIEILQPTLPKEN